MQLIRDHASLSLVTDTTIRQYIEKRITELLPYTLTELGPILVLEPTDTLQTVNAACGFDVCRNRYSEQHYTDSDFVPPWEVIEDHGSFYTVLWVTGQDGSGLELVVKIPELLAMCQRYAVPGTL